MSETISRTFDTTGFADASVDGPAGAVEAAAGAATGGTGGTDGVGAGAGAAEAAAGAEPCPRVGDEEGGEFVADLGGKVRRDQVELAVGGDLGETVGEQRLRIVDRVGLDVHLRVLDRDEVLVDQQRAALGRESRERQTDRAVAAAEVEAVVGGVYLEPVDQQAGTLIDLTGGEEAPGGTEA